MTEWHFAHWYSGFTKTDRPTDRPSGTTVVLGRLRSAARFIAHSERRGARCRRVNELPAARARAEHRHPRSAPLREPVLPVATIDVHRLPSQRGALCALSTSIH